MTCVLACWLTLSSGSTVRSKRPQSRRTVSCASPTARWRAWVTTDRQRFTERIIKIGLRKDGRVQILDGLQRGELVVSDGAVFLSNMLEAPPSD